jgi:hypothetical protein
MDESANGHEMSSAVKLVKRLRNILVENLNSQADYEIDPIGDGTWEPLPEPSQVEPTGGMRHVVETVHELAEILKRAGYDIRSPETRLSLDERWTFGSVTRPFPIRSIHIGFVQPLYRAPVVRRIPETVVAYLLAIPGERDLLEREHHNQVGWHYHYLDFRKRRSNVILCWDTRMIPGKNNVRPLFQEFHGEGGARFAARPDLWGPTKKHAMHEACAPDLERPISEFRCASNKAGPVWPLSATLTPVPMKAKPSK